MYKCDALTRTCIDGCLMGILCTGSLRNQCISDACYECDTDSDCQGTACNQFDWICINCSSDSDCVNPDWHCNADSGSCYECYTDGHCPGSEICHSTDRVCVECESDDDCTNPAYPECGKNNECLPPCQDECQEDEIRCNPNDTTAPISKLICRDEDDDHCLEWSSSGFECGWHMTCSNDACICDDECSEGESYCDPEDDGYVYECTEDSDGCWYYDRNSCNSDQVCSDGVCECEVHCTQMQKRCIPDDPDHFEVCQPNSNTGCMYWAYRTCGSGTQCIGEDVCPY